MNILDRFSAHLREALVRSIKMASELNNLKVEPVHLLFSLSVQKGSVAVEILTRFKCDPKIIEGAILSLPVAADPRRIGAAGRAEQAQLTSFSASSKIALERAMLIAQENGHNYIGTEHLLAALLRIAEPVVMAIFKASRIDAKEIAAQLDAVLGNASQFSNVTEAAEAIDSLQDSIQDHLKMNLDMNMEALIPAPAKPRSKKTKRDETALDFFATNLTSREVQKNIDPIIGREAEIERMIHILCRRAKNNPVLLGDPGVGKTAIVEGMAKRIMEGQVPDLLLGKIIYALDMGLLIAGTIYRGEFEARLRQVMDEVARDTNIILFIDELHNIVGAGSNQGTMDAANILKPLLARGQLRCIGATTPQEFKRHIEHDAALERRFQPIYVKESSVEDAIKILSGVKKNYEAFHSLTISDEAATAAAKLADRYLSNKFLPDKAIDLLDETAAAKRVSIRHGASESKLWQLKQKLGRITQEKEQAARDDNFEKAVRLKEQETRIKSEIEKTAKKQIRKKTNLLGVVTASDVAAQLSKMLGARPSELIFDEKDRLSRLINDIKARVVGQDEVVEETARLIVQAELGLSHPDRPLASFLFVGESGVGKTELARTLSEALYPGGDALIQLNMSEFSEGYAVSKILGSPAGYVGYRDSNQFTDKIKARPHSVVLLDEIDKAHKDVMKLLLQMLESGEITDSTGKKISLRHAIIILTTALGAEEAKRSSMGFGLSDNKKGEMKKIIMEKLKNFFSPEIINRLDAVCFFNSLTTEDFAKIVELELNELNRRLERHHTSVNGDQKIFQWLISQIPEKQINARDVRQKIRSEVESLMGRIILNEQVKSKYQLVLKGERLVVR